MATVKCLKTGIIFRNPLPHVRSVHAYHPSVVLLDKGEMLATMCIGQAFESADTHANLARSFDGGENWHMEGRILEDTLGRITSDACRISVTDKNEITAFFVRHDRSRIDMGLTNHETLGFVETETFLVRSYDKGHSWTNLEPINPPLAGPSFEVCSPVIVLKDGRWILPTSIWRGWDGYCPNGMKAVAFVSYDNGRTWPEYMDVMSNSGEGIVYWESKILELPDKRLLAFAWAYNEKEKTDLPNQYALSDPDGMRFGQPRSTGLKGQTGTHLLLDDGRILTVYRRIDKNGLWANISRIEDDNWINMDEVCLWGEYATNLTMHSSNMAKNFNALQFGAPWLLRMENGLIFAAFWAVEDCVGNIRWFKLEV